METNHKANRKPKRHFSEKTERATGPDVAGILGLSDQGFKTTVTDMLRALVDKAGSAKPGGECKQRDGNPKTGPNRDARGESTEMEMKNVSDGPDWT